MFSKVMTICLVSEENNNVFILRPNDMTISSNFHKAICVLVMRKPHLYGLVMTLFI